MINLFLGIFAGLAIGVPVGVWICNHTMRNLKTAWLGQAGFLQASAQKEFAVITQHLQPEIVERLDKAFAEINKRLSETLTEKNVVHVFPEAVQQAIDALDQAERTCLAEAGNDKIHYDIKSRGLWAKEGAQAAAAKKVLLDYLARRRESGLSVVK